MAYNLLSIVNDVNRRVNEVELSSTNFATASGFYNLAKDAVNASIRYVNQSEYEWHYNHVLQEDTLTASTGRYTFPDDAKTINVRRFSIQENSILGNQTMKLQALAYNEYI